MTDTNAQVSCWEKERECDNVDKPLDVLMNAITFAAPGGYQLGNDHVIHQSYAGNGCDELCFNMFLAAGGLAYQRENWGHILKDYHLQRPNAKADSTAVNRPTRTNFQFPLPAL